MLWDDKNKRIRIIDTDFFVKLNDITEQESYSNNIKNFYSELQMELGILNGQSSALLSFLQENEEYCNLESRMIMESFSGKEPTVTVVNLIKKTVEIFEQKFKSNVKTFQDMEQVLSERSFKGKREQFVSELAVGNDDTNASNLEDFIKNITTQNENEIEDDER